MSVQSVEFAVASLVPKPVTCSILLAEHNIFLSGFDYNGNGNRVGQSGTALLRGKLQLDVSKNVKIKRVQLKLLGRARTKWPEGMKLGYYEEESLQTQVLIFFDTMSNGWKYDYGNQCTYRLKNTWPSNTNLATQPNQPKSLPSHCHGRMSVKEMRRLPVKSVPSRSINKDSPITTSKVKRYRVFYPGTYDYFFELPIDHHQLETTKVQYGFVKWELHATVERVGVFNPNLHGMQEVSMVRVPDPLSLEMTECISISRQHQDQLHYDIIISGKCFPIRSKIPITFKLTPLAKVQVHEIKVFMIESIEYWTNDRRYTRKASGPKILLLNKTARKTLDPSWASSKLRIVRGSELIPEKRPEARETAAKQRTAEASGRHTAIQPLPEPSNNFLCDLNLGLESLCCPMEIEVDLQIPTCDMMAKKKELRLHPECIWRNVNVDHWIQVMMRINRLDTNGPMGTEGRNFEIATNLPFTLLNCRATSANINVPAYSDEMCQSTTNQSTSNKAHDPPLRQRASTARVELPTYCEYPSSTLLPSITITPPPTPEPVDETPETGARTPPPHYDDVVSTPSVDGFAGYLPRPADYGFDGPDED
ncbi:hypothetical protein FOCG_17663 [Fusarium oxysporum f. sp. radicis-lycopersici 26381]|nr:hypothetical protein FOCG_17663 [Fusarium oxysporum f. sp. radicis-lycopersici 26381]